MVTRFRGSLKLLGTQAVVTLLRKLKIMDENGSGLVGWEDFSKLFKVWAFKFKQCCQRFQNVY
jgi:hypothetical protein